MSQQHFTVNVHPARDAAVFVAFSDDIPGLVLEGETVGQIIDAMWDTVPQLLEENLGLVPGQRVRVTLHYESRDVQTVLKSHFPEEIVIPRMVVGATP